MQRAALAVSVLSAALWGTSVADIWAGMLPRAALLVMLTAAGASAVIAVLLFVGAALLDNRDAKTILARTVGDLTRQHAAHRPAGSLRQVR